MELSLTADRGKGASSVRRGAVDDVLDSVRTSLQAEPRALLSVESAPTSGAPLGFRYLYAAPSLPAQATPVGAQTTRTLVVLGMNPNTAARAQEGRLLDDATTGDIRALAGNPLTAPPGRPTARVLFLTIAPFRGIIGKGGLRITDSLDDLPSYREQHETNTRIIPALLDAVLAQEGGLDIVAMWGAYGERTSGRFALAGVRDLRTRLLALADDERVRWYGFGRTASGAPRNYAGLRYLKGMSGAQRALRASTLTAETLAGARSQAAWLSLKDPRAVMSGKELEKALRLPGGASPVR